MPPPNEKQIRDKLVELAHVWEDIERNLATQDSSRPVAAALARAFRVEAVHYPGFLDEGQTKYLILFSALDEDARRACDLVQSELGIVEQEAMRQAQLGRASRFGERLRR